MISHRRILIYISIMLLSFSVWGCRKQDISIEEPPANELTDIPALMDYWKVPGVSIAIIKDFKIDKLLVYGVRDANTKESVTESTLFQAASISKSITAMAALKYAQDGILDLDENINNQLTTWKIPENSYTAQEKVTWRRLLSHTAGVAEFEIDGYQTETALPDLVQILNGEPPANSAPVVVDQIPGSGFRYSNGGFIVIQQALIDLTQKTFPQIVNESVLEPLAMTTSSFAQPLLQADASKASTGHDVDGKSMAGNYHIFPELAAAGLWTTPKDLALYLIELQVSLQGYSNIVLNQQMIEEMAAPVGDGVYGLGLRIWQIGDGIYIGHDGINPGFVTMMIAHKSMGIGAVVMTNSDSGNALIKRILKIIELTERWPGF